MRKILFRGKCIHDDKQNGYKKGEWIYGSLFIQSTTDEVFIFDFTDSKIPVDPETVGQYIGLEDYSSSKVYEGDIVQDLNDAALGVVYWDEDEAQFIFEFDDCSLGGTDNYYYQVVGNKWDNPELLEEWKRQKDDIEK